MDLRLDFLFALVLGLLLADIVQGARTGRMRFAIGVLGAPGWRREAPRQWLFWTGVNALVLGVTAYGVARLLA